jgi:pilus assembly protein CpaF
MCLMAGTELPMFVLREMIASAVHLVIQISRFSDGTRKITSIAEITGKDEDTILMSELFKYEAVSVDEQGRVVGYFTACGRPPRFYEEFKQKGIAMPVEMFRPRDPGQLGAA